MPKKKTAEPAKPWRVDTSNVKEKDLNHLTDEERGKYNHFIGLLVGGGQHPKNAAADPGSGDMNWKALKGGKVTLYEGRLSGENRFTARIGKSKHPETGEEHPTLFIHQVGGHTK